MICPDCGEDKSLDDFPRNRATKSGRAVYCKACHNARGRESKERLHGGTRHYHLRRRYGIGLPEFEEILTRQSGKCAVCASREPKHVDHDHVTGLVRGILCFGCNGGLGLFKDNQEWLAAAIEYLKRPPTEFQGRPGKVRESGIPYIIPAA